MVDIDREEFGRGLRETRRYLLSHHPPADYHECYRVAPFGRTVRLCSRCVSIHPGIVLGLLEDILILVADAEEYEEKYADGSILGN